MQKPRAPQVITENIPEELRRHDCWVCWRYEQAKDSWRKPPISCHTGLKTGVTDTKALASFEAALDYYRSHPKEVDGLGFAFTVEGPFSGVDLDDCRDSATGQLNHRALQILRSVNSYAEVSPSGSGVKVFLRGKVPPGSRKRKDGIEIYSADQYFTVTGQHLQETPPTIEDRQKELLALHEHVFGPNSRQPANAAQSGLDEPDAKLLAEAMRAENGELLNRLWGGDTNGYPSASEADQALCRLLAFWFGPDPDHMERVFNESALGQRDKWLEREDYRQKTIQTALNEQTAFYRSCDHEPNEAPDDPHRLARRFVEEFCHHADGPTIHFWRDEWHRWDKTAYRVVPGREIRANLCAAIKAEFDRVNRREIQEYEQRKKVEGVRRGEERPTARKVTLGLVGNVEQALAGLTVLPANTEPPTWLDRPGPFPADQTLASANGLVHLPTLEFAQPTPRFFSPNALGYGFDSTAPEPKAWLDFLHRLWPDDVQSIETLQDWFGYCLLPDTRQQKMLLLVGPKRSGKGTIARVLKAVVGENNVAGPTLSSLATSFGLWPLLGKTVALVSDARLSGRTDTAVITERLLSISGEDTLTVDRKNLTPVHVKLAARFVILTNELPRVNDASGAWASRMLLLRLTKSFYGQEDSALTARLLKELPGILLWAVQGWRRLQERIYFNQPESGKELLGHLEDLGSPIGQFIRECCEVQADRQVPKSDLLQRWTSWCMGSGREHKGDQASFGRNLMAAEPSIRCSQPREGDKRIATYVGIGLARP